MPTCLTHGMGVLFSHILRLPAVNSLPSVRIFREETQCGPLLRRGRGPKSD